MRILYECADFLIVEKPQNLDSEEKAGDCLPRRLSALLAERGESTEVYPVHRLDRPTGGAIVYARTQRAAAALSEIVAARKMDKRYLAVILGKPFGKGAQERRPEHGVKDTVETPKDDEKEGNRVQTHQGIGKARAEEADAEHIFRGDLTAEEAEDELARAVGRQISGADVGSEALAEESRFDHRLHECGIIASADVACNVSEEAEQEEL